ncbi:hypothetical protein HK099_005975 [Clydaea vesicula]|uniref:Tubby C-terminal domain-containing protein n=1 Tax=Clydaea vesicula TaxID=447962 RepID=A0AAD5XYJ3_9FUNG|nr:hypothetical protein HK099_005975 [Clydaea vesicula]
MSVKEDSEESEESEDGTSKLEKNKLIKKSSAEEAADDAEAVKITEPEKRTEVEQDVITVEPKVETAVDVSAPALEITGLGLNVKSLLVIAPELFQRISKESILRCRVFRKKNILDKAHPSFFMYNEGDEKFLMAARKRKKSKDVNFIISKSLDGLTKNSKDYIAKLKANSQRTNFILMDARNFNEKAGNKGLKEIGVINYSKTVLPREMNVAIPLESIEDNSANCVDILKEMSNKNSDKIMFLKNKTPRWNDATQSHCLNFGGRVSLPSIKNFQLVSEKDEQTIIMQFGRCGPDFFSLDARWPMTPVEAFSIALTAFDAYDSA